MTSIRTNVVGFLYHPLNETKLRPPLLATNRTYPEGPMVGVGALIVRGSSILLVKRRNPPNAGKWSVPGGLVELGETAEDAIRREVHEELGIRIELGKVFKVGSNIELDESGKVKYHFVIVDFVARPLRGRIRLNDESSDYGWFGTGDVGRLDMAPKTREVVLKCLRSSIG
jgi:ADP-ribose pyrophosphatase YjhB (NUDIX family)